MHGITPFLLELPTDVIINTIVHLDARSLARLASTCKDLFNSTTNPVVDELRRRAALHGRVCNDTLPMHISSLTVYLAWMDIRYGEARRRVAGGLLCSFVTSRGRLFSCGDETRLSPGLLGRDEGRSAATFTLVPMSGTCIHSVTSEFGLGAAIDTAGQVYTWGSRHLGRRCRDESDTHTRPSPVDGLAGFRIISLSTGGNHCLAVAVTGELFAWGVAVRGLCGGGGSISYQTLPSQISSLEGTRVRSASAGTLHSLVVTESGDLYSFGRGNEGQLGHRGTRDEYRPRRIRALAHVRITAAAAAGTTSLALASDGTVFQWGSDGYGDAGSTTPQQVTHMDGVRVRSIVAHCAGRCAVACTGDIYTWGSLPGGLLGHGRGVPHQPTPRRVDALLSEFIEEVSFGSMHALAVIRGGGFIGWGELRLLGLAGTATTHEVHGRMCYAHVNETHLHR